MTNHVILCGLGELGFRTLERLRAFGEAIVVVDPNCKGEFKEQLQEWGIPLIAEHGNSPRGLRDARVLTARALIAVTDDDMSNLAIALAAREENPDIRLVVRLFNHRLIEKVEREIPHCRVLDVGALAAPVFAMAGVHDDILHCLDVPGGRFLLRQWRGEMPESALAVAVKRQPLGTMQKVGTGNLGFSIAAPPEWELMPPSRPRLGERDMGFGLIRADESENPAMRRAMGVRAKRLFKRRWRELYLKVRATSQHPLTLVFLILVLLGGVAASLFREELSLTWFQAFYFVVTVLTTTGFGDISLKDAKPEVMLFGTGMMLVGTMLMAVMYASVTDALLSLRLASVLGRRPMPQKDHVVLCGFGTVGYRIAEELSAMGHSAVAIERQERSRLVEQGRRQGMPVVVTPDIFSAMNSLHVEDARCVMAVTDDDTLNLELAISAQESNPDIRVVVRLFDPHLASLVERSFGIHLARSPSAIAAPAFAVAASADDLLDAFDLGDVLWCVGRVRLTRAHALLGRRAAELWREQVLPLSYCRAQNEWDTHFLPEHMLQAGDEMVILTPRSVWLELHGN